jgi:hypothetical protein
VLAQYVKEAVNWTDPLTNSTYARPCKTANCEEWRTFSAFFSLPLSRDAEEWRVDFTQRRVK